MKYLNRIIIIASKSEINKDNKEQEVFIAYGWDWELFAKTEELARSSKEVKISR